MTFMPTSERLALIAQKDPGLDDNDIGQMFGRTQEWSAAVRRNADAIRAAEYIPAWREWIDPGLQPRDPSPEEIAERARKVREASTGATWGGPRSGIRQYAWRANAFVQVRT